MQKIAEQVKEAEVRGCVAAFIDAGLVKIAGQEEFDAVCSAVTEQLPDAYDMQKIAAVTDAILENSSEAMTKTAAETARNAALGELLLMKTAGEIDEDTFVKTAGELMKMGGNFDNFMEKATVSRGSKGTAGGSGAFRSSGNVTPEQAKAFEAAHKKYMANSNGQANKAFDEAFAKGQAANAAKQKAHVRGRTLARIGKGGLAAGDLLGSGYLAKKLYDKYAA